MTPTIFNFADILCDFDDGNYGSEYDQSGLELDGEADDEGNDGDDDCIVTMSRKL